MKILGFEIKKAQTAAEPTPGSTVVKVLPSTISTQPSIPLKRSYPRAEIGDSGTRGLSGIITEEYNPQLQGVAGVKIYDQMRRSDGTVRAAILACTLPIRRAKWFVNAVSQDPKDVEIANMVEHSLFDWLEDMTWDDVVRQALLSVSLGVMTFEKVYGIKDHDGKSYVTLKKLAPRLPTSIQQWELPDKTFGIQQIRQDGVLANIPGSKLLIFVNEREGDNWWGTSMLRAAYKHWYYKDGFYKIDAVAFERQGMGIPKITMPVGYTESDERKASQAMQNLRSNESAFLLLPPNYTAEFMDMGSSTTRDPERSINHHNKEILQSVLAQFLELGQTSSSSGSRATSEDHSDLFLKAVDAIANMITSEINKKLIPELVDLNFNDVTIYPKIDFSGISKVDVTALGTTYSQLVTAGGIKPINGDEQYLRAMLGLPARTQEDDDQDAQDIQDGIDMEPGDDSQGEEEMMDMDPADPKKPMPADNKKVDDASKKKPTPTKTEAHDHRHDRKLKRKFDDGDGFMSWRPLTFAEKKVSFSLIEDNMNNIEDSFDALARTILANAKDAFMEKLYKAMQDGDTKAIQDIEIKFISDYKALLKDTMKKAYEYGKNNVSTEIGVAVPSNNAQSLAEIDLLADSIATKTAGDLESKAKIEVANALKQDTSTLQAAGSVDATLEKLIDDTIINTKGLIVSQSINNGRNDVFERNADNIHGLQRSEILDDRTCNFCLSMDGRVIDTEDSWAKTEIFHSNCRGIWVAILNDEQDKPDVGGIPDNLGDYYTGVPNGLIQPPRPMTLPGTLADDFNKASKKK